MDEDPRSGPGDPGATPPARLHAKLELNVDEIQAFKLRNPGATFRLLVNGIPASDWLAAKEAARDPHRRT